MKYLPKRLAEKYKYFNSWSHKLWEIIPAKSNWTLFKALVSPATARYTWVVLEECEAAYLNDFAYLLLKGQTVHLSRPKNECATDMCIQRENTIPFFATRKEPIEFIEKYNIRDEGESP